MTCHYRYLDTPIGRLMLVADANALKVIEFPRAKRPLTPQEWWVEGSPLLDRAALELGEYFAGDRKRFATPLAPEGTEFQRKVWDELQRIPYGHTTSYGELARRIGRPEAARAVGAANGRNPLPIVIPCHRVIGKDGTLTGFGGGLSTKERLLSLEASGTRLFREA